MGERRLVERRERRRSRKVGTPLSSLGEQSRPQGEGRGLGQEQEWGRRGRVERGMEMEMWTKEAEEHFFDQEIHSSR